LSVVKKNTMEKKEREERRRTSDCHDPEVEIKEGVHGARVGMGILGVEAA